MVRAKFKVTNMTVKSGKDVSYSALIELEPVIGDSEENKKFWDATPSGSISLSTTNEKAASQFERGKEYYVDFTPAE